MGDFLRYSTVFYRFQYHGSHFTVTISKEAPGYKGTAMGAYSTSQFLCAIGVLLVGGYTVLKELVLFLLVV